MDEPQTSDETLPPPYFSFKTLTNLLIRMEEHGPPPRIDRSFLGNISFSVQPQVMAGLRSLGLIEQDGTVTPLLVELAQKPDDRTQVVGDILRSRFPEAVKVGEQKATHQQLEEVFKGYGVTGDTLRKALAFYLQAAVYADLPVSPHFKKPRSVGGSTTRPAGTRRRRAAKSPPTPTPPARHDAFADLRTKYVETLLDKFAAANGEVDAELANRIERLVGFEQSGSSSKENQD